MAWSGEISRGLEDLWKGVVFKVAASKSTMTTPTITASASLLAFLAIAT